MSKCFFSSLTKLSLVIAVVVALAIPTEVIAVEAPKPPPPSPAAIIAALVSQFAPHLAVDEAQEYGALIAEAAEKYALDPVWVCAVIWVESRFRREAVSGAGAIGLMQVMPSTAGQFGVTPPQLRDPRTNIFLGTRYLALLRDLYKGDLHMATVAYNQGRGNVARGTFNKRYLTRVIRRHEEMQATLNAPRQ